MIELLTVVAIIAVLATLLLSAVGSAKKSAYQTRCISNLRQVSLAFDMYVDDHSKRSPDLGLLTSSRYLPDRKVLICPADKTGNWGGIVEPQSYFNASSIAFDGSMIDAPEAGVSDASKSAQGGLVMEADIPLPRSYLTPLAWEDAAWDRLMRAAGTSGIAVCQLHGLGKPDPDFPSMQDFQGLILRAQRDGAVVRRKVYWDDAIPVGIVGGGMVNRAPSMSMMAPTSNHPYRLFTDDREVEQQ